MSSPLTERTLPMTTESTHSGLILAASSAALPATSCRSVHVFWESFPQNAPNGVRLAPTMKTPVECVWYSRNDNCDVFEGIVTPL